MPKPIKGFIPKKKIPETPDFTDSVFRVSEVLSEITTTIDSKVEEVDSLIGEVKQVIKEQKSAVTEEVSKVFKEKQKEIDDSFIETVDYIKSIKQGEKGADAVVPSTKELVSEVLKLIPPVDEAGISKRVLGMMPQKKADLKLIQEKIEIDPMSVIEKILALPEEKLSKFKLKSSNIDGLDQTISAFKSQIGRTGYVHGGGDTVVAGTNVTITTNANGQKVINASGGGGSQTPWTGDIDGATYNLTNVTAIETQSLLCGNSVEIGTTLLKANIGAGGLTATRTFALPDQDGTFAMLSDITGFVPYTGAGADVDLGANNLTSTNLTATGSLKVKSGTAFEQVISGTPTAARTITLQDADGTLAFLSDIGSSSLTATYVGYGDGSNLLTGDANFTWDASGHTLSFIPQTDITSTPSAAGGQNFYIHTADQTNANKTADTLNLYAGNGNGTGKGGDVSIYAGLGGSTSGNGGDIFIAAGAKNGAGTDGKVTIFEGNQITGLVISPTEFLVYGAGSTVGAILDTASVLTTDKTFTFNNSSGGFVVADGNAPGMSPSTTFTPAFTEYYGGNGKALGDPVAWIDVNIAGSTYKMPLYS